MRVIACRLTTAPRVYMHTVEIPMNQLRYRFRKLTWREEVRLAEKKVTQDEGQRIYLTNALTEVVGFDGRSLVITAKKDAEAILLAVPLPILKRIWVLYQAALPKSRHFTTQGLYLAPEPRAFVRRAIVAEEDADTRASAAVRQMESRFGGADVKQAQEVEQQIVAEAKKRGQLQPVRPE